MTTSGRQPATIAVRLPASPASEDARLVDRLTRLIKHQGRERGRRAMQLELLVPLEWRHPGKEVLKGWYGRLGRRLIETRRVDEAHPHPAPLLATRCEVEVYEKPLSRRGRPVTLVVVDHGVRLEFSFADLMRYHGPGSPGGVAHAYKVLERALPLLAPDGVPERREITVRTAFGGPGARDAFEMVLRAVTGGRYAVDPDLARPGRGRAAERFVFVLSHRDREVTLAVRDGFVTDEFIDLARAEQRTAEQEGRLTTLKAEMAERVMGAPADAVYLVE